jgi:transposase-like protein
MMEDIDTWSSYELICPYCGHHQEIGATSEGDDDFEREEVQCENCGKTFHAFREVNVSYQTWKKKEVKK